MNSKIILYLRFFLKNKLLPSIPKSTYKIFNFFVSYLLGKKNKISYSRKWYEEEYHIKIYHLDKLNYESLMKIWEKKGYKKRLYDVLDKINIFSNAKWLEVACHHGKTVFWSAEKFSDFNITFFTFDFSNKSIEWIKKYNPI